VLRVEELSLAFGGVPALAGIDLEVGAGERLAVLGPSGSGKSTLLRAIAGLERPDAGRVLLDGRDLAGVPPHLRGIGLMHQDGVLFPHRDVAGNVEFGLRMAGIPRAERARRTAALLELVGLAGFERRSTGTLSGGERQRVALARTLAPEPRVLLLDEPLGSLDRPLRDRLAGELVALADRLELTLVHVTHDADEAFAIGDRVAIVSAGRVVQHGTPDELWSAPASEWAARFLGLRNVLERAGRRVLVRPEGVRLVPGDAAVVLAVERRGAAVRVRLRLHGGEEFDAVTTDLRLPRPGDRVGVELDPAATVELPPGT
jgi:thiamine transport system ATP-binding protein